MNNRLEATDKLVMQLESVHSVLQFNDEVKFDAAVKFIANELQLTKGYVELLIELLVERGELEFRLVADASGYSDHLLRFVGGHDLDLDLHDLERIDLEAVSKSLVSRLETLKIERGEANAPVRQREKRGRDLRTATTRVSSAENALRKADGVRKRLEAELETAKQRVAELTRKRDDEQRRLDDLRAQDDR